MKLKLILTTLFVSLILLLSLRGIPGNTHEADINHPDWQDSGPFELSPERGRFALTMSIVENKSFYFSLPIARFATPDLGYKDGHYVSLFAPGVSFLAIPGYLLGRTIGLSQVGAFLIIVIFAVTNTLLIILISRKLSAHKYAAILAGLIFIFATPAFAYGVTLYQHHVSTFLILMAIYILLRWQGWWAISAVWTLCALSIPVDYPNVFLMFPLGIVALTKIINLDYQNYVLKIRLNLVRILTVFGVTIPLLFFGWFNLQSYGSPWQFSGTVASIRAIDSQGQPASPEKLDLKDVLQYLNPDTQKKSAVAFFKTRYILNGLYIHLLSPDRGVIFFTPIILLGIFGAIILYQKRAPLFSAMLAIVVIDLLLYSMWGDPWGGWAFGSRYLIPAYAIMAIFIATLLSRFSRNVLVLAVVATLSVYSISVNTLGALSSSANPPQVEVLALEEQSGTIQKYTYERNLDNLNNGLSKSFVFQSWAHQYLSEVHYFFLITGLINLVVLIIVVKIFFQKNDY